MTEYRLVKHDRRIRPGKTVVHALLVTPGKYTATTLCGVPLYNPPTAGNVAATTCKRCRRTLFFRVSR